MVCGFQTEEGECTLHVGPNFDMQGQDVVSEEVLHFVLEPLLREDSVARQGLFDELLDMAGIDLVDESLLFVKEQHSILPLEL